MKKQVLALVGACALGFTATAADDWFNGGIETGWPNAASMKGGEWANTNGSSYADGKVTVSADTSAPLTFAATNEKTLANDTVTIASALTFTAFDELPAVPAEAKAGVISCGGYFYILAKGDGDANVWTKTDITAAETADVTVTFTDGSTATYQIGASTTNVTIKSITTVQNVCMSGDGAISSLSATTEAKAVGPQTPDAGGGSVAKVEGQENVYEATPSPEGNVTIIPATLKDTDTILITVTNDVNVTGVPADQIKVVFNETVISNSVFVGGDSSGFSTKLSEIGSATFPTESGTETIPVKPQLSNSDDAVKPFVVGDDAAVGVKTIPGLTYKLVRYSEIGTEDKVVDTKPATETRTELKDTEKPADKAFYIIEVTK